MASINEEKLMKALMDLEKGDALQAQDTEGTFSTEGSSLSNKGTGNISKMMSASDMGSDEDQGSEEDMGSGDPAEKAHTKKSMTDELNSSPGMARTMNAVPFLDTLAKSLATRMDSQEDQVKKLKKSISRRGERSEAFNAKLAKAITEIGKELISMRRDLNKALNLPAPRQMERYAPPAQETAYEYGSPYGEENVQKSHTVFQMIDAVSGAVQAGEIPAKAGIDLELSGYDLSKVSPNIRKSIEARLPRS